MRGSTFSEHVSTYFNSVLETFTDYYPTSANSILPQISSAFAAQELQLSEKLNTIYACVALVLVVLYLFKQLLHLDQMGEAPLVHMKEGDDEVEVDTVEAGDDVDCDVRTATSRVLDIKRIMDKCSIFKSAYKPTWFWGKSGHIQTVLFGVMQKPHKAAADMSECKQYSVTLPSDGSVVYFHVYEPLKPHESGEEVTLLLCPGIFGSYNKSYVQSTVGAACSRGYRIVCLNHLGVLEDVQLKTPRLFTYGNTEEYAAMCEKAFGMFPDSLFISIGYSMGGNQVCKYLGEQPERQKKFVTALSICQGYDCIRASVGMTRWDKMQAVYSYILTQRWISLVEKHPLIMQTAVERGINWKDVKAARGLGQFDRLFSALVLGV
ncbi:monoacylglycerol lipase ABHD2-like isoform X2 [Convolutriloba macropyga]|uniref:monoacylglycerol lipase ABHD2-like isoform X2 n=1 Tax=Convolutriloba macropyga TaxID=536237 RepID=UPI003F5220B1